VKVVQASFRGERVHVRGRRWARAHGRPRTLAAVPCRRV